MHIRSVINIIRIMTSLLIALLVIQGSSALGKQGLDENRSEQTKVFAYDREVHSLSTSLQEVSTTFGPHYLKLFNPDEIRQSMIYGNALFAPISAYDSVETFLTPEESSEPAIFLEINQALVPDMSIHEFPGYYNMIMFLRRTDTKSVNHHYMRSYDGVGGVDKAVYDERVFPAEISPDGGFYQIDRSRYNEAPYTDPFSIDSDYGKEEHSANYGQLRNGTLYRIGGPDEIDMYKSHDNAQSSMGGTTRIPFHIRPSWKTGIKNTLLPDMIYVGTDISVFTIVDDLKDWRSGISSSPSDMGSGSMKWLNTESGYIHFEWELGK